jgi:hypothetical protein
VKNPNQAALLRGTSSVAARQAEDVFFDTAAPWNRLTSEQKSRLGKYHVHTHRPFLTSLMRCLYLRTAFVGSWLLHLQGTAACGLHANQVAFHCVLAGTLRLREAMSKQLVKMAATARPTLMAAAQEQLVALRAELATLPPAAVLGDGHAEMLRLIDDVSANIHVSAEDNQALGWRCVNSCSLLRRATNACRHKDGQLDPSSTTCAALHISWDDITRVLGWHLFAVLLQPNES